MSATAAQRRFWGRLAELGCIVCGRPAQIAHAHSGSVRERTQEPKAKGKKLQRLDWLVIPMCPFHHGLLDCDVKGFEAIYGPQAGMIDRLCKHFGLNLWTLSRGDKQCLPAARGLAARRTELLDQ
jgi:hypothetical protein